MNEEVPPTAPTEPTVPDSTEEIKKVDSNTSNTFQSNLGSLPSNKKGDSKALLLILGLIVLVIIGVVGFFLRDKFTKSSEQASPSPTEAAVESTPTPVPTPSFDRSKFTLRILNGTDKAGLAATVSAKLKGLGYQISKTGNATSSSVPQTLVKVKASATGLLDQLIQDLAPDYTASAAAALKDSDDSDAEITIGAK